MPSLTTENPYPGLRPFDLDDGDFFFGRAQQIEGLRKKVRESRLVAVVGPSGCGKSSLVRAGLVPALLGEKDDDKPWRVAMFRPEGRPFQNLIYELLRIKAETSPGGSQHAEPESAMLRRSRTEAMLRRDSKGLVQVASELAATAPGKLLIVIDQFEEIFRFEDRHTERADDASAFVQLLVQAARVTSPSVHIVLTMRLDFLGDCAKFQGLPETINQGQFLVPNLSRSEQRAAIEEPARRSGSAVSAALTQRLLNELGGESDELPVLQHVLMRTWQESRGARSNVMDLGHYEATGGLKNAISRHASAVFDSLSSSQRDIAERLFKAISDLDWRGRGVRRPRQLGDIARVAQTDVDTAAKVVEAFRAPECSFLMPFTGPLDAGSQIDISHESLLWHWDKMTKRPHGGWLVEEDRNGRDYRNLVAAAEAFEKDPSDVLSTSVLRQREAWMAKVRPNEAWAERYGGKFSLVEDLLKASRRRATRRRYQIVSVVALFIVVAFGWIGRETFLAIKTAELEQQLSAVQRSSKAQIDDLTRQLNEVREAQAAQQQQVIDRTIQRDTENQVPSDAIGQISAADAAKSSVGTTKPDEGGFLWIGSAQQPNLQNSAGVIVSPNDVRKGEIYTVIPRNIFVRSRPPESSTNYFSPPATGIIDAGTRIEAVGEPIPYERPSGIQYWLRVRVVPQALATVYFQFATATRAQAQSVRQALQEKGYKIPGEERTNAARGQEEVRYRDKEDKDAADKLAKDAAEVLKTLGYRIQLKVVQLPEVWRDKSPKGVLQLWLDLPTPDPRPGIGWYYLGVIRDRGKSLQRDDPGDSLTFTPELKPNIDVLRQIQPGTTLVRSTSPKYLRPLSSLRGQRIKAPRIEPPLRPHEEMRILELDSDDTDKGGPVLWARVERASDGVQEIGNVGSEVVNAGTAGRDALVGKYGSDWRAVESVLSMIEPGKLENLTADGRANALYFLKSTDPSAWKPPPAEKVDLVENARKAAANIKAREKIGVEIGSNTRDYMNQLESLLDRVKAQKPQ